MLLALWSANSGTKAIFGALNIVYDEDETRGFIGLAASSLLFTLGSIGFFMIAAGVVVLTPIVLRSLGNIGIGTTILSLFRWPLIYFVMLTALSLLYRFGPSRRHARWRWITIGSSAAALL